MEVPHLADLVGPGFYRLECTPIENGPGEPPAVAVSAWADDGTTVHLWWDELHDSVAVRWCDDATLRLGLYRESVARVVIAESRGRVEFTVWSDVDGLWGSLDISVGVDVRFRDQIMLG